MSHSQRSSVGLPPPPPPSYVLKSPVVRTPNKVTAAPPPPPVPTHAPPADGQKHVSSSPKKITTTADVNPVTVAPFKMIQLNGHVGIDSLPHQFVKKRMEQGFHFNLLVVGDTGSGKSTLVESLFNMQFKMPSCSRDLSAPSLTKKSFDVVEGGVQVKLTIIETAGFGSFDKEKCVDVIVKYVDAQYEAYLNEELAVKRLLSCYDDTRVHACLYLISPVGSGLRALDVAALRALAPRVNVVPVIAKADTSSKEELTRFKQTIIDELRRENISTYQFPTDDDSVRALNESLNALQPYAVVGSTDFVPRADAKGTLVRARTYPWGIVEVENEAHCDFVKLREALLRTNVDALCERTSKVLYEEYRRRRLREMRFNDGDTGPRSGEALAAKRRELDDERATRQRQQDEEFRALLRARELELHKRDLELEEQWRSTEDKGASDVTQLEADIRSLTVEKQQLEQKASRKSRK